MSAHGGQVTLRTAPGEGATFRVSIPWPTSLGLSLTVDHRGWGRSLIFVWAARVAGHGDGPARWPGSSVWCRRGVVQVSASPHSRRGRRQAVNADQRRPITTNAGRACPAHRRLATWRRAARPNGYL
ncbi:hypothetical protein [Dactylosporangium darangshiense]|uniref:hypothetical protein n=1 Tax=Dactylosporangium darangshiense TaxID=579108 RepID=UPI0036254EED